MTAIPFVCALALTPALADAQVEDTALRRALADADVASYTPVEVTLAPRRAETLVVPVSFAGETHTLRLIASPVRASTMRVWIDKGDGTLHPIAPPPSTTYTGSIDGHPGATVTASITDDRFTAIVRFPDATAWSLQPTSDFVPGAGGDLLITSDDLVHREHACEMVIPDDGSTQRPTDRPRSARAGTIQVAELAWEVDWPAYQELGSSVANSVAEVERITNDVNAVYERDVLITHTITDIIVRTSAAEDPYTATSTTTTPFLGAVSSEWNAAPLNAIPRDLMHLLTGKNIVGTDGNENVIGVAYVDTTCSQSAGIGISENLSSVLQEAALVAHELGHNWSANHCNADPDCRIMCSGIGGCDGLNPLQFEASAIASISSKRDSVSCLDNADPVNDCVYDINTDGNVDIVDFGVFGAAFNSSTGDANYDPALDSNMDGNIDIVDFGVFGSEFNRTDCLNLR